MWDRAWGNGGSHLYSREKMTKVTCGCSPGGEELEKVAEFVVHLRFLADATAHFPPQEARKPRPQIHGSLADSGFIHVKAFRDFRPVRAFGS